MKAESEFLDKICQNNPEIVEKLVIEILKITNSSLIKLEAAPEITIVLPIYNEQENIPELYRRLTETLNNIITYEIIFVDDGSKDSSASLILDLRKQDKRVKLLSFSRNFGHQAAVSAGLDHSKGDAVILMDSDLQDPPEVLPDIIRQWREGGEIIYAVRKKRKESFFKKTAYFTFYRLLNFIANIDIPLDSGDFCLIDKKVVSEIKSMPERNRFLRGLRSWVGFRQIPFEYERDARFAGTVKYNFRRLMRLALNGIFSFSTLPLRLATYFGFLTIMGGLLYSIYAVFAYFSYHGSPQGWTSMIVLFLLVNGVQLLLLGIIGEYLARVYDETKQRPNYIVKNFFE